jgi:hypothetical protein
MADAQTAWQQIWGKRELAEQRKFALSEPGGLGTFGLKIHLEVSILQELRQRQLNLRTRK